MKYLSFDAQKILIELSMLILRISDIHYSKDKLFVIKNMYGLKKS